MIPVLFSLMGVLFLSDEARAVLPQHQHPSKPEVVIYTIPGCFGCGLAKSMFEDRHIPYTEINLTGKPMVYRDMIAKAGGRKTVPQIFINGKHIGGYSDLNGSDLDDLAAKMPRP